MRLGPIIAVALVLSPGASWAGRESYAPFAYAFDEEDAQRAADEAAAAHDPCSCRPPLSPAELKKRIADGDARYKAMKVDPRKTLDDMRKSLFEVR